MGLYEDALAASQSRVSPALPQESVPDVSGILATPSAKPVKGIGEEFASGIAEGTLGLATGVGGVLKVAGDAIGSETLSQVGKDTINYWRSASAPYASDVPSYKNVQGFNDAMKYLAHGVGTIVPTSVMSLGAGGIGAGLARGAAAGLGEEAITTAATRGALMGAGGASYGMELGQIGEQQAEHNVNAPGTALAYAAPAAALDVVTELPILAKSGIVKELRKIPGLNEETGNIAARFAKGAGKQSVLEGGQEAAQSALESLGAQQPLDREDIINSAIIGAAGGVVMGGPTSALGGHAAPAPTVADTKKATTEALLQKAAGDPTPLGALVDQNASGMKGYLDVMQRLSTPQPAFQATANEGVSAPVVTAPPTAGQFGDVVPGAPAAERLSVLQDGIPAFENWGRGVKPEESGIASPAVLGSAENLNQGYLGEEIPGAARPLNSYPAGLPQVMNPETLPALPQADVIGTANSQLRPTSSVAADRVGVETPKAGASLGQFGTKQEMYRYALQQTGSPEGARAWMQKMYATEAAPAETKAPAAQPEAAEPEVPQGVTKRDFLKAKKDALAAVLTEGLDTATRKYRELTAQAETIDGDSVVTKKETSTLRGWQEVLKGYGVFVGEERRSDSARRAAISAMSPTQMQAELLTSHLTDMPNKRAYESAERKPVQVAIDADNLKWVNDNMGHGNGDQLLQKVGAALKAETDRAYHVSGDEFIIEADTAEQAREIMFRVNQKLASEELRYVAPSGKTLAKKGLEISYGIGNDLHAADEQLRQSKKGKKAGRGALPAGVVKFSDFSESEAASKENTDEQSGSEDQLGASATSAEFQGYLDRALEEFYRRRNLDVPPSVALKLSGKTVDPLLQKLTGVFGKEIKFFKATGDLGPAGFYLKGIPEAGNILWLNERELAPHLKSMGHELVHALREQAPDLYDQLEAHAVSTGMADTRAVEVQTGESPSGAREEVLAEFVGERMMKKEFWDRLSRQEPTLFDRMVDALKTLIAKVKAVFSPQDRAATYFKDIQKVEDAALEALARYAKRNGTETGTVKEIQAKFAKEWEDARPEDTGRAQGQFADLSATDQLRYLGRELARKSGRPDSEVNLSPSADTELSSRLERVAQAFGKSVVTFSATGEGVGAGIVPDGLVIKLAPGTIFINDKAVQPHLAVLGHELSHSLEFDQPGVYRQLYSFVEQHAKNMEGFASYHTKASDLNAELVGDVLGRAFTDPDFWVRFNEQKPGVFKRVYKALTGLIQKILDPTKNLSIYAENYIRDYERVRDVMADVLAGYTADEITVKYSRADMQASLNAVGERAKPAIANLLSKGFRVFGPLDRVIDAYSSRADFAPLKEAMQALKKIKRNSDNIQNTLLTESFLHYDEAMKAAGYAENPLKRNDPDFEKHMEKFHDVRLNGTLWGIFPDKPSNEQPWSAKSWADGGMVEKTGITFDAAHAQMQADYDALPKSLRDVYHKIQAQTSKVSEGYKAALKKKIVDNTQPGPEQDALLAKIDERFGSIKGPYTPLMRYGDHVLNVYDQQGGKRLQRLQFESYNDMLKERQSLDAEGLWTEVSKRKSWNREESHIPADFLKAIEGIVRDSGTNSETAAGILSDIDQLWFSSLPETSVMKHSLRRSGLAGYDRDSLRGYLSYTNKVARATSYLTYGGELKSVMDQMDARVDEQTKAGEDPTQLAELVQFFRDQDNYVRTERISPITRALSAVPFLWYLASPSTFLVQSTQPFAFTLPKLASIHGIGESFKAITKGYKNQIDGAFLAEKLERFNDQAEAALELQRVGDTAGMKRLLQGMSPEDKKLLAIKMGELGGTFNISLTHEALDVVTNGGRSKGARLMQNAAVFMRVSELMSRKAAFAAAFDLEFARTKDFEKAVAYGENVVDDTLFNYSQSNRPIVLTGNLGRLLGQFQTYRLNAVYKMIQLGMDSVRNESPEVRSAARKELAFMMGTVGTMAGTTGLPFAGAALAAINFLFGDADDPFDAEETFSSAMRNALGDTAGNVVLKGLPALLGVDVSKRVGMEGMFNLFNGDPPENLKGSDRYNWYAGKLTGPIGGVASGLFRSADAFEKGNWYEAVKAAAPKPIADLTKAIQLADEGQTTASGKTLQPADSFTVYDWALAAVGIQPLSMSLASEEHSIVAKVSARIADRRAELTGKLARAVASDDPEGRDAAAEEIGKFNRKVPGFALKSSDIANAIKRELDTRNGVKTTKEQQVQGMLKGGM